jgi:hypothetical protein
VLVVHQGGLVVLEGLGGLGVNRGLPLLSGGRRRPLDVLLMSPGRGALGLLNRSALKKSVEFIADSSPLRGRWLGHRSKEDCCRSDVLAGPGEDQGLFTSFVLIDATLDVARP